MEPIELIAIDLDDTLLRDDISISEYTKAVLKRAQDRGVRVVIATGRMFQAARPWGQAIGLGDVPLVVYTGSMVARCESGEVLSYEPMELATAQEILDVGRAHGWYMQTYIHDQLYVPVRNEKTEAYERACGVRAEVLGGDFWTLREAPLKVLIYEDDPAVMAEAERVTIPRFEDRAGHVRSSVHFLEWNKKEASKGRALTRLCGQWGVPLDRVMTFGNSQNDVSMLELTPWSFAVANAAPEAMAAARYRTASNNEDGVAKAVAHYVLGEK